VIIDRGKHDATERQAYIRRVSLHHYLRQKRLLVAEKTIACSNRKQPAAERGLKDAAEEKQKILAFTREQWKGTAAEGGLRDAAKEKPKIPAFTQN